MAYLKVKSYKKIDLKLSEIENLSDEIKILLFNDNFGLANGFDKKAKNLLEEKLFRINSLTSEVGQEVQK